MATLKVKGDYEGPGERRTAEFLAEHLPSSWTIFFGRKLPGPDRADTDFVIVGERLVFLVEEKAWGPRVVPHDSYWQVKGEFRANPLNRVAQLSRKLAGEFRRLKGFGALGKSHRVIPAVVLSHPDLQFAAGAKFHEGERVWRLDRAAEELAAADAQGVSPLGAMKAPIEAWLDDRPRADPAKKVIGPYDIQGRLASSGGALVYDAVHRDTNRRVELKTYPRAELRRFGDPHEFLERESRAIWALEELGRTWKADPFLEDETADVFAVPLVPPAIRRSLDVSLKELDPSRPDGRLPDDVAREVVQDAFRALADVHGQGVLHRALHPSRIWLGRQLRVMFSDLHFARMPRAQTIALWVEDGDRSDDYRAPEVVVSLSQASVASDVYSLALCLITWLSGKGADDLTTAAIEEELAAWEWAAPLRDSLEQDPALRPTAATVADRLAAPALALPDPSQDLPSPDVFDEGELVGNRWRLIEQLGAGGFGTTWLARDEELHGRRVIKQFHSESADEVLREFETLEKIRNRYCARVYDAKLQGTTPFLVQAYVEGSPLSGSSIRTSDELVAITECLLEALIEVHELDLVHGDVTPGNIIVDAAGDGRATLIDFGLTRQRGARPGGFNPSFAAPETVRGGPTSPSSDLYGLAASLGWAMLGRHMAVVESGGNVRFDPPTELDLELWDAHGRVLLGLLCEVIDPSSGQRPQTATELRGRIRGRLAAIDDAQTPDDAQTTAQDEEPEAAEPLAEIANPTVAAIRRLYRGSTAGNAGNRGLDDAFARSTYVPTLLDDALLPRVVRGDLDVVLLSGNPGDGKTSVLVSIGDALRKAGAAEEFVDDSGWRLMLNGRVFSAVYDASESHEGQSSDDLMRRALEPTTDPLVEATALIAINDGRLMQFFTDHEDEFEELSLDVRSAISGEGASNPRVAVVDLKQRSLATLEREGGLASRALAALTNENLWDVCGGCSAKHTCPILASRQALDSVDGRSGFEELVLISHLRKQRRATFRDLRSAASWLITGDRDCPDVHAWLRGENAEGFESESTLGDLAFDPTAGDYLIAEWSQIDPALVPAPEVDRLRRVRRREGGRAPDAQSAARQLYFAPAEGLDRTIVRPYRYLDEFVAMLQEDDEKTSLRRVLLGASRIAGAYGFQDSGLAVGTRSVDDGWAVVKPVDASEFELVTRRRGSPFIEAVADSIQLRHRSGASLVLSLDMAEVLLRAADGELIRDRGADTVVVELERFANHLARQASFTALIIDAAGDVAKAEVRDDLLALGEQ
ncbi:MULTISPECIES: protein kinase [unclassified Agrococcus]|uniref:protein kinase domain-containing protein n=1 Tax=unclassified Agrococcus TaxID=2615065 RepID=UPI003609913F